MGHYDTCYAEDAAEKMGPVTNQEMIDLIFLIKREGPFYGFDEQGSHVRLKMVANQCENLVVLSDGYKRFKIVEKGSTVYKQAEKERKARLKQDEKLLCNQKNKKTKSLVKQNHRVTIRVSGSKNSLRFEKIPPKF